MPTKLILFSYGSNTPKQLAERLERNVNVFPAFARGWRRVYRGWSDRWQGGPASLIRKAGKITYGNGVMVTEADLKKLDRYEGVLAGKYKRIRIFDVEVDDGHGFLVLPNDVIAYVSTSTRWNAPSRAYLEAIAKNVGTFWKNDDGSTPKPQDFYNED